MGAQHGKELDILVEDDVAKAILLSALPAETRTRVTVTVIGSASALSRQLAATYIRGEERPCLAVFDGDQEAKEQDNLTHAKSMAENVQGDFAAWFSQHVAYLPGDTWPEAWLVQKAANATETLCGSLGTDADTLSDILEYGLQAGKHNEFFEVSKQLGLDETTCLKLVSQNVCSENAVEFDTLVERISCVLTENG